MNANPLGRSNTLYKKFCNFLKRLLDADVLARGPGGPGRGVPRRPVRWDGCPRSGVDGSLLSVWTAVRATNSTRRSSSGAGGASILMPPLLDGLPNILILPRSPTATAHWMARRSARQSSDRSIVRFVLPSKCSKATRRGHSGFSAWFQKLSRNEAAVAKEKTHKTGINAPRWSAAVRDHCLASEVREGISTGSKKTESSSCHHLTLLP